MSHLYDVTALGNPVFDYIETPYVKTDWRVPSGCSFNAALTIGKLGGKVSAVGRVGEDFLDKLMQKANQYGVSVYPIISKESGGFYLKYLDQKMDRRELRLLGDAGKIRFEEIPGEALGAECYIVGPILGEVDLEIIKRLKEVNPDSLIMVDPQGLVRRVNSGVVSRVRTVDSIHTIRYSELYKPNEHEAAVIFPDLNPVEASKAIVKLGCRVGIVTVAERGSFVSFEDKTYHVPAFRTMERDPTGCGDVYIGAYTTWYLSSRDPLESAIFASAAASFMVESVGPDFKIEYDLVMERFESLVEGVERL